MVSLSNVFVGLEDAYIWTADRIRGHFTSMWEILSNTWHSENNPIRGFGFDFTTGPWPLRRHWELLKKNYPPLLAAFVYSFGLLLTCKGLLFCVRYAKRTLWRKAERGGAEEARRWLKQAELDHYSSHNDMDSETPAYEWVCFKCHQATEKAVKAALISRNRRTASSSPVLDLHALCQPLHDGVLSELVGTLQHIVGVTSHMSYPDSAHYPKLPRDLYRQQEAMNAWHITSDIIQHVYRNYLQPN